MEILRPVPNQPAAIADLDGERALIIADYHAGIEASLRAEQGLEHPGNAATRRERLLRLVAQTEPDRLVVLGDFMHSIGAPGGAERGELEVLVEQLPDRLSILVIKGNHDGEIETWLPDVEVTATTGRRLGPIGMLHGHTWPTERVLDAPIICMGHEHPQVRLTDTVGGSRVERVWLRGSLDQTPFAEHGLDIETRDRELVICPAFNDLVGGTWVNVDGQSFLAPFLPAALPAATAYLLDGTTLGGYQTI